MCHYLGVFVLLLTTAIGLTGYNCEGEGFNITILSFLDIGECVIDNIESKIYVQLMQISDYDSATVFQCQLQIKANILLWHAFTHSHGQRG